MEVKIKFNPSEINLFSILGVNDQNVSILEEYLCQKVSVAHDEIACYLKEDIAKETVQNVFEILFKISKIGVNLKERDLIYIIGASQKYSKEDIYQLYKNNEKILLTSTGKKIFPKTFNQINYIKALKKYPLVFGIGPAGTGKTYLAVSYAVSLLKSNKIKKIIITRPAVEAGESLGFLPGDLKEKVDPYLTPIYDALNDMLGTLQTAALIENGTIEIAPLAYMRGRTLENAVVILDEAQNTTNSQMKMFLTRLGFSSQMIVTGDPSQVDLPPKVESGLRVALKILKDLNGSKIIEFEKIDVVRHPLVQRIVDRYEKNDC